MKRTLWSRIEDQLAQRVANWRSHRRLRAVGAEVDASAKFMGVPVVSMADASSLVIEARVVLTSASRWTALGVAHPVVLRTLRPGARLRIGRHTGISGGSICAALSVDIGERCLFGADVMVTDTDFHPIEPTGRRFVNDWNKIASRAVKIGNDVFIGARAVILKGVEIGDGAVVGAGAVVSRSVPAYSVVAGNPAVVVREGIDTPVVAKEMSHA